MTYNRRVCHRPLCSTSDTIVKAVLVSVIPTVRVSKEQGVDVPTFEDLGQFDPVFEVSLRCGLVFGILRLVSLVREFEEC
jgi:hypothetical protein